ncbi:hypothetical protein [Streptomyces sp. NBC_00441]|uniref:hypothetical protein n=1 Tax=Streptomyces sp. NBC_00441 TaxID=2975742 RepID=UPI002E2AB724|nr:hypothetical protein [Streptomyces sp. NBC_00441]
MPGASASAPSSPAPSYVVARPGPSGLPPAPFTGDDSVLTDTTLRQTVHVSAGGDHVRDGDLPGATTTDHWYLLSGVEVWARGTTSATAVLGDSLTDGRGSTTNGNDR